MSKLVVAELRAHAAQWVWTLLVATIGGAAVTAVLVTADAVRAFSLASGRPELMRNADGLGATLLVWVGLAVAAVVASTASVTLAAQARSHALWKVLGVPGRRVYAIVTGQLFVLGAIGALVGAGLGVTSAPAYAIVWEEVLPGIATARIPVFPGTLALGVGVCVAAVVLGGNGAARRASRTSEMQALREAETARARIGWGARAGVGSCVLVLVSMWASTTLDPQAARSLQPGMRGSMSMLFLLIAALLLAPWTIRPLLFAWTAAVPGSAPAWHTAREACRHRSGQSMATITPFAVAVSLTGTMLGMAAVVPDGGDMRGFWVLFGPVFLVSAAGGVANIALTGAQRTRDAALLAALGATDATRGWARVLEGTIYAITGISFGLVATVLSVVVTSFDAGTDPGAALSRLAWVWLAWLAVVSLGLSVGTVVVPALRTRRMPTLDLLREPV